MAMAFIVLVASELIAAESGLGFLIMDARNQFRSDWMFVGMISMGILGYLLNLVLLEIERRVLRWRAVTQTK
jgi:ABC-type nitrate/sulfonate/bicarbonate transport system permease component